MNDTVRAIKLLADVQGSQIRKQIGCEKLNWTPWGKCVDCSENADCRTCHVVKNEPIR